MCVKTMQKKISIGINAKAKENKTRHVIFKFKKIKDKGKILKGVRGEKKSSLEQQGKNYI